MRPAKSRSAAQLGSLLERRIVAYVAAAGAGLLGATVPAEAEIIYTPSNTPMAIAVQNKGPALTELDMNNDGTPDFTFVMLSTLVFRSTTFVATTTRFKFFVAIDPSRKGNEIVAGEQPMAASAVPDGETIGPQQKFGSRGLYLWFSSAKSYVGRQSGSWELVEYAYVGLKFVINGEVHYGWARIKFAVPGGLALAIRQPSIYGYAYESTPNKPIVTGDTGGSAEVSARSAASANLGMLAVGAAGLDFWRTGVSANLAH